MFNFSFCSSSELGNCFPPAVFPHSQLWLLSLSLHCQQVGNECISCRWLSERTRVPSPALRHPVLSRGAGRHRADTRHCLPSARLGFLMMMKEKNEGMEKGSLVDPCSALLLISHGRKRWDPGHVGGGEGASDHLICSYPSAPRVCEALR